MKVRELIKELQVADPDATVVVWADHGQRLLDVHRTFIQMLDEDGDQLFKEDEGYENGERIFLIES